MGEGAIVVFGSRSAALKPISTLGSRREDSLCIGCCHGWPPVVLTLTPIKRSFGLSMINGPSGGDTRYRCPAARRVAPQTAASLPSELAILTPRRFWEFRESTPVMFWVPYPSNQQLRTSRDGKNDLVGAWPRLILSTRRRGVVQRRQRNIS